MRIIQPAAQPESEAKPVGEGTNVLLLGDFAAYSQIFSLGTPCLATPRLRVINNIRCFITPARDKFLQTTADANVLWTRKM